jgi:5-formyltetrahydrofolate cyclo-ligase
MEQAPDLEAWRRGQRKRLVAERQALAPEEKQRRSAALEARLVQRLSRLPAGTIGLYWPIKGEFDPRPLGERLSREGRSLALPAVTAPDAPLEYRPWRPGAALVKGRHGIPEPEPGQAVKPAIVLVPLLGFDAARHRLGYGGGYFDRTLAALRPRPIAIGVGFELGRLATIDPQPHDAALDFIVTEAASF